VIVSGLSILQPESRLDNGVFSNDLSHTGIGHVLENIDQVLKIHSFLSLRVSNITRESEKNIENCFFHINLRPGAWTSCNKSIPVCDKSFEKTPLSSLLSGCVSSKPLSREIALKTQAVCLLCDIYYMILLEWNTKLAYCILIKLILQSLLLTFFFAICFCKHVKIIRI
jgi:hypothetical protein